MDVPVMTLELVFACEAVVAAILASSDRACMLGTLRIRAVLTSVMPLEIGEFLGDGLAAYLCTGVFCGLAEMVPLMVQRSSFVMSANIYLLYVKTPWNATCLTAGIGVAKIIGSTKPNPKTTDASTPHSSNRFLVDIRTTGAPMVYCALHLAS